MEGEQIKTDAILNDEELVNLFEIEIIYNYIFLM